MPERHSWGHGWMWPELPDSIQCPIRTRGVKMLCKWIEKAAFKLSLAHTMLANIPQSRA